MNKHKTVLAFGEVLWDILPGGAVLGGAPFNFACRMHELGRRSLLISRIGVDAYGERALKAIQAMGLNSDCIQSDPGHPTGIVNVRLDAHNNADYEIVPEMAYDYIALTDDLVQAVTQADAVCFGVLAQRQPVSRQTLARLLDRSEKSLAFLDINLRKDCFSRDTIASSLARADILKLNEDEVQVLSRMFDFSGADLADLARTILRRWSLQCVLVTLGDKGVFAADEHDAEVYVPGYRVKVEDTVGAGDAFSAGFVHVFLQQASLGEACEFGNRLGAIVATQRGATLPVSSDALREFDAGGFSRVYHREFAKRHCPDLFARSHE